MPGIGQRIDQLKWNLWGGARHFRTSQDYWEMRYRHGGNSGAGSYDRLARFKATFLNDFVAVNHISTVIEFGSGDGSQLALATYPDYVGVDVSETALAATGRRFADKPSIRFLHTSEVTDRHRPNCRCPWTSSTTWSKTPFSTPTCLGFSVQQHDSSWCTPATKTGPGRHPPMFGTATSPSGSRNISPISTSSNGCRIPIRTPRTIRTTRASATSSCSPGRCRRPTGQPRVSRYTSVSPMAALVPRKWTT